MINIVVFDDNNARREGLQMLLDAMDGMACVATYSDCSDIIENLKNIKVDVILMDINMPNVNGIEGVKLVKKVYPDIKIIMQTIFEDESRIIEAISAGADGYIMKQKSPLSLVEGIKEVMNGGAPITPSVAGKILKLFKNRSISSKINAIEPKIKLTKRETEILGLLVDGYSYKMIAEKCFISYPTVNTHVSHIYEKLKVKSVSSAVAKAIREGLV